MKKLLIFPPGWSPVGPYLALPILKSYLKEKENIPEIPKTGIAVLRQQMVLVDAIEKWISSLKENF